VTGALTTRQLLLGALPAFAVGVLSSGLLWLLDTGAELLEHQVWHALPLALGVAADSPAWIIGVLTATGLAVGLIVQFVPGHGGHDTATIEFIAPVLPLRDLPSVAAVIVIGLAGGVSLGPEGPIIAIATAVSAALLARVVPSMTTPVVIMIAAAATVGAMFGTPVAAALVLTGMLATQGAGGPLWDRLFRPLAAAASGAVTTLLLGGPTVALTMPAYIPQWLDLLSGTVIALVGAGLATIAVLAFRHAHALFRRLRYPVVYVTLGGVLLGILGTVGGPITLFKGLNQMVQLVSERESTASATLVLIVLVKIVALVIAAAAGFRGGRIFPAIFIGVALGVLANSLLPGIPLGLAIAAGVLGVVLVVARDGWLALFLAAAVSGDLATLPILCVVVLPAWLIVRNAPEMIVHPAKAVEAIR